MTPPKTKEEILKLLETERRRLEKNLASLKPEEYLLPGVVGEWNLKDVLAHLADWEAHMPGWVDAARSGDPVEEIEPGLTWDELEAFNQRIYARHKERPLKAVLKYFHATHQEFISMVAEMPDEEMLEPGRYKFLGSDAIYDWITQYAAHDRWAKTHLRKWRKSRQK